MSTSNPEHCPRIAITYGEPAGIGPDILLQIALSDWPADLVCYGDPLLLANRASQLGLSVRIVETDLESERQSHQGGQLHCVPIPLPATVKPGILNRVNAPAVVKSIEAATRACLAGDCEAYVTAPVQKSVINEAGIPFSGHTEFLADLCAVKQVVMMLAAGDFRVALATTHLPLKDVPAAIEPESLTRTLRILHQDLQQLFGITSPLIHVAGLNPHAGESGHLGREEIDTIIPVIEQLRQEGLKLEGPLPADTLFTPRFLQQTDAILAMYHDQGLPVLKHVGFGEAINITLGLPIIRTSVDHGTALPLAASGQAETGSMKAALQQAIQLAGRRLANRERPHVQG